MPGSDRASFFVMPGPDQASFFVMPDLIGLTD